MCIGVPSILKAPSSPGRLIGAMSCPVGVVGGNRKAPGKFGEGRAVYKQENNLRLGIKIMK